MSRSSPTRRSFPEMATPTRYRDDSPWPLPYETTTSVCLFAGREASAALRIALGRHRAADAALEATYNEPFTFWDWHGVPPSDTYSKRWKTQRMWEYHRGFHVDGTAYGYPTPWERWQAFKSSVEKDHERALWVRRIAVAHWMTLEDLNWIASNLTNITSLDLGDAPTKQAGAEHPWSEFFMTATDMLAPWFATLKWLGLPDFRDRSEKFACWLVERFLPRCTSLQTLSIRGRQTKPKTDAHEHICRLGYMITQYTPGKVTTLELRFSFPYLDRLMECLKDRSSNIRRIGIDFGSWIQMYPHVLSKETEVKNDAIEAIVTKAAENLRVETYEKVHSEKLGAGKKWILPESRLDQEGPRLNQMYLDHAKNAFEREFYVDEGGSVPIPLSMENSGPIHCPLNKSQYHQHELLQDIEEAEARKLPAMLNSLYETGRVHEDFEMFALEPEWQKRSTDPVHPFALLQGQTLASAVYQWLDVTFNWRPVFDWDCFLAVDYAGACEALLHRWGVYTKPSKPEDIVIEIAKPFKLLRKAGIPVHILIARRHPDQSSLYWGGIGDDVAAWAKWLRSPIEANLTSIAPMISTLTIMYDLRNPLDKDQLLDTNAKQPGKDAENATCPRPICPWRKQCPFPHRSTSAPSYSSYHYSGYPMASTSGVKVKMSNFTPVLQQLAPNLPSLPPTGHISYNPNEDDNTLHAHKRNALLAHEAVAWQKFWTRYAPLLTGLEILNIRMPAIFDRTSSVNLANLLDVKHGWEVKAWAYEGNAASDVSVQTDKMIVEEWEKVRNAGYFVRRTWVKKSVGRTRGEDVENLEALHRDFNTENASISRGREINKERSDADSLHRGAESHADPTFLEDKVEHILRPNEELNKAIARAEQVTKSARDLEAELDAKSSSTPRQMSRIEKLLNTVYGKRIRRVAQHVWEERMGKYLEELDSMENSGVLGATRIELEVVARRFPFERVFVEEWGMRGGIGIVGDERKRKEEEEIWGRSKGFDGRVGEGLEPEYQTLPIDVQGSNEVDGLCGSSPLVFIEPALPVEPAILIASSDEQTQGHAVDTPILEDILTTLSTYGGVLTQPRHPLSGCNGTSDNVRESIEISTTGKVTTETISPPTLSRTGTIGQKSLPDDIQVSTFPRRNSTPKSESDFSKAASSSKKAKKRSLAPSPTPSSSRPAAQTLLSKPPPTQASCPQAPPTTSAPGERTMHKRKDPVVAELSTGELDNILQAASSGRTTRATTRSRSGTPAPVAVYKEASSDESGNEKTERNKGKGKGKEKGRGKRKADEEWGDGARKKKRRGKRGG